MPWRSQRFGLVALTLCAAACAERHAPTAEEAARSALAQSMFGSSVKLTPTATGCTYQKFESAHRFTTVGELSQCLELPLLGDALFSFVYSDFVTASGGGYYVGGIAGTTLSLTKAQDAVTVSVGPSSHRYLISSGHFVSEDGPDGSWFEWSGSDLIFVDGSNQIRYHFYPDGLYRAIDAYQVGGLSGTTRVSGVQLVRTSAGQLTQLLDDFGRGTQITYQTGLLSGVTDIETGLGSTLTWQGALLTRVTWTGANGGAVSSSLSYAGANRLVGMGLPDLSSVAWDRPNGAQIATTRFLNPTGTVTYSVTSAGCIATDGSRIVGKFGHPFGSSTAPASYRVDQLLASGTQNALPTRRLTNDIGKTLEWQFDAQNRLSTSFDDHAVGYRYAYAGSGSRVSDIFSAATNVLLAHGDLATDPSIAARLLYSGMRGLDGLQTTYTYDAAGRTLSISRAGQTMRRSFNALPLLGATRTCDSADGQPFTICSDEDAHGMPLDLFDNGASLMATTYANGLADQSTDALGDRTSFHYSTPTTYLTSSVHSNGEPTENYAYTGGGALQSVVAGVGAQLYGYTDPGVLNSWMTQIGQAQWAHLVSQSKDLLTTDYFINGIRQWSDQQSPAPQPAVVSCTSTP